MFSRLLCTLAVLTLAGCDGQEEKTKKTAATEAKAKAKSKPTIPDVSNDTSFQAFVGHLRAAVAKRDRPELATLLAPDFGYRWDEPPPGENPFDYWDKNNLWSELDQLLSSRFLPHENYMVAPVQFVTDTAYKGHRVGIRLVNGSWKLAYFISGEDVLQ